MKRKNKFLLFFPAICLLAAVLSVVLVACNKEKYNEFAGTYFFVGFKLNEEVDMSADVNENFYVRLFENGTVEYYSPDGSMATGTYQVNSNKISIHWEAQDGVVGETIPDWNGTINSEQILITNTAEVNGTTTTGQYGFKRINIW